MNFAIVLKTLHTLDVSEVTVKALDYETSCAYSVMHVF
jgi:hypothetical protein